MALYETDVFLLATYNIPAKLSILTPGAYLLYHCLALAFGQVDVGGTCVLVLP